MDSVEKKPHAVCIPFPAQGHIKPMLNLAKLLHFRGFQITFVNTEFNHRRLLKARGPNSLDGLPSFQFETIPDGLQPSDVDATQDIPSLCVSTKNNCLPPFRRLLSKLNHDGPPVTCIFSDAAMSFTLDAAQELGIPDLLLWTASACGFMAYVQYRSLMDKGFTPLKDESYLTNGYLDTVIDWIPGMKGIRLKDMPSFIRTTDPDDVMLGFAVGELERARKASAIILNTFDALEQEVLDAIAPMYPPIYTIGPLQLLLDQIHDSELQLIGSNLWKEDEECLQWLDSKGPNTVVYVNFGSITVLKPEHLIEPDLVSAASAILPPEFLAETKDRGLLASWCSQERVLGHPAVGGFLTHSGWNSILESVCCGVAMICWPFFAEQQTNCRYCCTEWGIGMEIDSEVKRDDVERLVRELMEGEKGEEMKKKTMEWKKIAHEATTAPSGSSFSNLDRMIKQLLL
ncbi:hypothetical protein PVL29_023418 [Vitis rotundifolia]|uniref:Glycosyltransferase N-terminal domain-containing protein n=1 Tax=Vitis rotundifolia TaxID=103349 RepID=A0AA39D7F6_VITRO|nr:hypothetical protein PVL29_023418 [Vitis rotundifolia]